MKKTSNVRNKIGPLTKRGTICISPKTCNPNANRLARVRMITGKLCFNYLPPKAIKGSITRLYEREKGYMLKYDNIVK